MDDHDMHQDGGESKSDHTPFWLFYTSDWAAGTIGFTLEQRGFYFEALRRMWERKDGLIDDVKWLASAIQCDPRTVRRIRGFLINQGKLRIKDGLLINDRARRDIARWKRRHAAKIKGSCSEDQPKLALIFPEKATDSTDVSKTSPVSHTSDPDPYKKDLDRSFEPVVIEGGRCPRPAQYHRYVTEEALDKVRTIAPRYDRQELLARFNRWAGSKKADNPDAAFIGWVKKIVARDKANGSAA